MRLMALLGRIMIRAAKADLVTIPPCHHKVNDDPHAHPLCSDSELYAHACAFFVLMPMLMRMLRVISSCSKLYVHAQSCMPKLVCKLVLRLDLTLVLSLCYTHAHCLMPTDTYSCTCSWIHYIQTPALHLCLCLLCCNRGHGGRCDDIISGGSRVSIGLGSDAHTQSTPNYIITSPPL